MVSPALYWTLLMLSCFGQYLGQDILPRVTNGSVGGSVLFTADVPPSISIVLVQWVFGSTIILSGSLDSVTIFPGYTDRVSFNADTLGLELRNLRLDDSGTYRLTVIPNAGDQLTGETSLRVFVNISDVSVIGPGEQLIEGKSSANITSEGNGNITSIEWMKDNSPLSPSNSIVFSSDNRSVSISPVRRSDSGQYQCTYRNPVSSQTATLSLIINYGPEDVSINGPNVVDLGVDVELLCSAVSVPSASFSWTFNDTDTDVTTNTFTIDKTEVTHSGDYICSAHNDVTKTTISQRHALLVKEGGGGGGEGEGGLSTGAIVGIVIGVLVAVAGISGLIVFLIKTNKIPKVSFGKKGQRSGAAQNRQEPELNYADISHFQKTNGERVNLGRQSEPTTLYAEVNHGAKTKAPPPPYESQASNPPPVRR